MHDAALAKRHRTPWDSTLALRADPYGFISRECRRRDVDLFETRILLRPTTCMTGRAAAQVFYDLQRFRRSGAAPEPLRATLFGKGGVQGLDGVPHRHRKSLFLNALSPARLAALGARVEHDWEAAIDDWSRRTPFRLYEAVQTVLSRSVCAWAGIPLTSTELADRTRQLVLLFDGAAGGPMRHLQARAARRSLERWLGDWIDEVRSGRIDVSPACAVHVVAHHTDEHGQLLPARVAAVELLNLLRPTIAVSVYIVFIAHALHHHSPSRLALRRGDDPGYIERFVQEVRRLYPFFPAVVARVREPFEWSGHVFPRGRRVMLDLHGTNHDPRVWSAPHEFRPERFAADPPSEYGFIPQGGAEPRGNHRCPGEDTAILLMKVAADVLCNRMRYRVPDQDTRIDMKRLPALPRDGFMIADVTAV